MALYSVEEIELRCRDAGITVSLLGLIRETDAARLLGVSTRTLFEWRTAGTLPYHRLNSRVWYRSADLAALLNAEEPGRERKSAPVQVAPISLNLKRPT